MMQGKKKYISIIILLAIAVALVAVLIFVNRDDKKKDSSYTEYTDYAPEHSYAVYMETYKEADGATTEVTINAMDYTDSEGDVQSYGEYEGKRDVVLTPAKGFVEWTVKIPQTGFYQMKVDYLTYGGDDLKVERSVYIDGELPYDEAEFLVFERSFVDVASEPAKDIHGHDIKPNQEEESIWQQKMITDASGYYDEALKFYLTEGEHKIRLASEREPLMIGGITLCQEERIPTYKEYLAENGDAKEIDAEVKVLQAEDMYRKSEKSNYPINDRTSVYTQPQETYQVLLNTMGGTRWQKVGSSVSWEVEVEETGYYKIAPRYKQNYISGMKVCRKLLINGEVPFQGADNLEFNYDGGWQCEALGNGEEEYLFYFEKGQTYVLEMEVVLGSMDNILRRTSASLDKLNEIYKEILMITGATPDKYRDYSFDKIIPDELKEMGKQADELAQIIEEFKTVNGASGEKVAQLTKTEYLVRRMAEDPDEIAGKFSTFQDNLSALGTWITDMSNQPLCFDYIALIPNGEDTPKAEGNFFEQVKWQAQLFASSFSIDYSAIGQIKEETEDTEKITVWISTGRDQMNTLRSLINSDFTKKTGIAVELELVTAGTLLRSVSAGTGPDVALNNAIGDPINLALRNAVYDLSSFDDFEKVVSERYSANAMAPYTYKGKTYAMPETMHFYVMYYRQDILNELGLKVPTTWKEWDAVISELSKKNMQVGLPHDENMLLTFMYQMGSELYNNEGESVNLDSKEAYLCFEKLTEYYTLYGFETEYDFVNRFRSGEMPLAIVDYTVYNQLSLFAPEIQGNWGMSLIPGTELEDGTIDRTTPYTGTSTVLLSDSDNPDAAWEFMKWWSSTEVQAAYCNEMETVINASAKQPTANLEALKKLPWADGDLDTLIAAWNTLKGTPQVPGGYYVTRTYGFAFNRVINDNEDPSETLQKYIENINSELTRKRREFGIEE